MQGRRRGGDRIRGPYWNSKRGQWQYSLVVGGKTKWVRLRPGTSEAAANEAVEGAGLGLEAPAELNVKEAVGSYIEHVEQLSGNHATVIHATAALKRLVDLRGTRLVADLAASDFDAYLKANGSLKMASQATYWKVACRLARWLARRGLTPRDVAVECLRRRERRDDPLPWCTLAGKKALGRGKPLLRNMIEVEAYLSHALKCSTAEQRVAAALPLLTGIASGELLHLRCGAVDFGGRVIWVRDDAEHKADSEVDWTVKSPSRRRPVDLPGCLEGDLAVLAAGDQPGRYLFRQNGTEVPRGPSWLRELVQEVCKAAGVRVTCPHGLRGTHATVLVELGGRTAAQIGEALGHGNDHGQTAKRHYMGSPERTSSLRVILGGAEGSTGANFVGHFVGHPENGANSGRETGAKCP